jgi:Domain of unknown function (DUF4349)
MNAMKTIKYTVMLLICAALLSVFMAGCKGGEPLDSVANAKQVVSRAEVSDAMGAPGGASIAPADAPVDMAKQAQEQPKMPRKIIYTADVVVLVDDLSPVEAKLKEALKASDGFIASATVTGSTRGERNGVWKVRIPVAQFETFLQKMKDVGEVQSSSSQSDDVSEEFYDVAARIKNKKVEEERLIQHLKTSTGKLTDILAVEREISRVREEIERMEGRLRFLTNQTDLTTITLTVNEAHGYVPESAPTFRNQIGRTFGGSITLMADFFKGAFLLIIGLLPWLLLLGVPAFLVYRRYKQHRKSKV